jgi:ubiquinone/menaquinone biosynthesis C-methylase UbiE
MIGNTPLNPTPAFDKQAVRSFWDSQPCGTGEPAAAPGSREFFEQLAAIRYRREPFIRSLAAFSTRSGQRVLEVGCGAGTDTTQFALAGARLTSVDLSLQSLRMARQHLAACEAQAQLCEADAEKLPFADASFDVVYSWGVIHHTPDMPAAIAEIARVLRPGGQLRVMIYHRHSWVTLRVWVRHALLQGRPWKTFREMLARHVESTGTQAFTRRETRQLFRCFDGIELQTILTAYDAELFGPGPGWLRWLLPRLARATGDRWGWFLLIKATKPARN